MEKLSTIREQLEEHLRKHGMTINRFAELSGVNSGTLSNILNGNRPISMQQLDRITSAMGFAEGFFYDLYIDECIFHATPDWRRLGPFLQRCAELDKLDCLDRAIRMTMDNIAYAPMLFEMAEELFQAGKKQAATLLYQCVAESEKFQHSERLALCQYRLFMLGLSDDQEENLQAAVSFEPYIDRLDEGHQLGAYVDLINVNISLNRWNKVRSLAEKMLQQAKVQYKFRGSAKAANTQKNKQPLIFYILYAYLSIEYYYSEARDYDKALYFVSLYQDPEWVIEPNAEESRIIEQFKEWAVANRYLHRLKAGHFEVLTDYVEYVSQREDEIFTAVCNIMIVANLYKLNVDHILDKFKTHIVFKEQRNHIAKVSNQVTLSRFTRLLSELGIYYLNSQQFIKGIEYILKSLEYCIAINSSSGMLRCMGIFEEFRQFATDEAQEHFKNLVSEVRKLNDEKIGLSISYL